MLVCIISAGCTGAVDSGARRTGAGSTDSGSTKRGPSVIEALKILALPKKGGGFDPCQDFFGGFVEVSQKPYSGILKLKMT